MVRTELKEIDPPKDVQETMNKVVKAENEKIAAIDFATATETMADGQKRAEIKKAEGIRQAEILKAEGDAQAIQLVNEAADRYFVGNAQLLKRLQTVEESLQEQLENRPAGQRRARQRHRRSRGPPASEKQVVIMENPPPVRFSPLRTILGPKVSGVRVTPLVTKIVLLFSVFLLVSNFASNYINLEMNRGELVG